MSHKRLWHSWLKSWESPVCTLQRYSSRVDDMALVLRACGLHGGSSLVRGYKMPPLVLSPEKARAAFILCGLLVMGR